MKVIIAFWTMLFLNSAFGHEVTVRVSLSPAGKFEAKTSNIKGEIKKTGDGYSSDILWLKVADLKTGIDLRDEHFRKHLSSDKYPKINLSKITASNGTGTGTLTVNEVSKAISFTYKVSSSNKLEAVFKVKNSEFNLKNVNYMGIGVEDDVEVVAILDI